MTAPLVQFDAFVPGSPVNAFPGFSKTHGLGGENPVFDGIHTLSGEGQEVVPGFGDREVTALNGAVKVFQNRLTFQYDEETDRIVATLINPESGEEVKQIPTQEALDAAFRFEKVRGMMFDGSL